VGVGLLKDNQTFHLNLDKYANKLSNVKAPELTESLVEEIQARYIKPALKTLSAEEL
jgi:hypothetical protein